MKVIIFIGAVLVAVTATVITRNKRQTQAYQLPAGSELIFPGQIKTTFQCPQTEYGIYADVDNACYLFHVCHTQHHADGSAETVQYSFICGNQTVFDQLYLTCTDPDNAIPCGSSQDFLYLNARIGQEKEFIHVDADIERGNQLKQGGGRQGPPPGRG